MNTGFVRPAVATVLTACGIETLTGLVSRTPFTPATTVATVLTACGIETTELHPLSRIFQSCNSTYRLRY